MTALATEKGLADKREKRAKSIAAMGLVNREGDRFRVSTPSLRGKQTSYEVWRDEAGKVRCNCLEYEEAAVGDPGFRCEHILAVKFALVSKNTEPATKQNVGERSEAETHEVVSEVNSETESRRSVRGEQKKGAEQADVVADGQVTAVEAGEAPLTNTNGEEEMKQEKLNEVPFEQAVQTVTADDPNANVLDFTSTLRELRKNVDPELVKSREGWRDRNGNTHYVDYVEWHTVADILDRTAPNWSHSVKDMRQIGEIFTVTVAITIDGVTREGVGTGIADSELGIKKAEHDALKRAAVKFGIARDLYKKESDVIDREGSVPSQAAENGFPSNPVARSLSDLVTAKQLGMIRALARELGIDADEECNAVMHCKTDELSKKAASALIQHFQDMQSGRNSEAGNPMRRVG